MPTDLLEGGGFRVNRPIAPSLQGPADLRINSAPRESLAYRIDKPVNLDRLDLSTGDLLRLTRHGTRKTLTEFAKELGFTRGHLSAMETSKSNPTRETLLEYEERLGLDPGVLIRAVFFYDPSAIEEILRRSGLMEEDKIKKYAFDIKTYHDRVNETSQVLAIFHRRLDESLANSDVNPGQISAIVEQLNATLEITLGTYSGEVAEDEGAGHNLGVMSLRLEKARLAIQVAKLQEEVAELKSTQVERDRENSELSRAKEISEEQLEAVRRHLQAGLASIVRNEEVDVRSSAHDH